MKRFALAALAALALITVGRSAVAADGAEYGPDAASPYGDYTLRAIKLCDTKGAAATSCSEFDTGRVGFGTPTFTYYAIESTTGCSGNPVVTIRGASLSGGTTHTVTTLTKGGTDAVYVLGPVQRYVSAGLGTMTDCTNVTVMIGLYYRKIHP